MVREIKHLLAIIFDFRGIKKYGMNYPIITAVFYGSNIVKEDWDNSCKDNCGNNTHFKRLLTASAKKRIAERCIMIINDEEYVKKYTKILKVESLITRLDLWPRSNQGCLFQYSHVKKSSFQQDLLWDEAYKPPVPFVSL